MWQNIKTALLLALLDALFLVVGGLVAHRNGLIIAAVIALAMNGIAYWKSDRIAIAASHAREVSPAQAPELYHIVSELAAAAGMPTPRIYIADDPSPNAFATGRNPAHAAVCCTTGILNLCTARELRGVLSHELSHVRNRDILTASMAATIALGISIIAQIAQFSLFFIGGDEEESGAQILVTLLVAVLAAPAAAIIQLAISRSREYEADHDGAVLSHDPLALADALRKLEARTRAVPLQVSPALAPLYIVNPFGGRRASLAALFSTHPPLEKRIARLERMAAAPR
ncbi:MAG: M48 family metalloprotease [Candidatus Dormibacteraeota bacterium]|nr:M48 family metalloprotease [Candidatus Dormibacteraeota bacterium]